jgi:(E)-4-hydroxy-3-methylbut-2-enyl-diphosphate synthase
MMNNLLTQPWGVQTRHPTHEVQIGRVKIGGNNPVAIQSMTNTDTGDVDASVQQTIELADAGSELVRVTVNNETAAQAVPRIKEKLLQRGYDLPIIGDFHYNGHLLLSRFPECAASLDKYRINPGNVGVGKTRDTNFEAIIGIAMEHNKPVRIGVNWGSLDRQVLQQVMDENARLPDPRIAQEVMIAAVVKSALQSAQLAESLGMPASRIVLSAKMSHVPDVILAYTLLAANTRYALHVGLTEAGIGSQGIVASTAAIGHLLLNGIGDTIRVSLTPRPGAPRTEEVETCQRILQSTGMRRFRPSVTSCPGCGRTTSTLFQEMAQELDDYLRQQMPEWKRMGLAGVENLHIAVMGCVVNGPGESKNADIGISLPGSGENPRAPVYVDGKLAEVLQGENMMEEFKGLVSRYVVQKYGQ